MYLKIVNRFDMDCLEQSIAQEQLMNDTPPAIKKMIMDSVRNAIIIFDEYYGASRHPESDLGGFVIFLPTLQDTELFYAQILNHYTLEVESAESIDIIADCGNRTFVQQTYLLSSDFGIVLVLPLTEE